MGIYNFSEIELLNIKNLYVNEFKSIKDISTVYDVDNSVIKSRLLKLGVKICQGSAYSEKYWLCRGLTIDEAKEKIKKIRPTNVDYWLEKGYSFIDAEIKVESQKLTTLRGHIDRYGYEEGLKIWESKKEKRIKWSKSGSNNLEYWLKRGFSHEEANQKLSDRQKTFSLEKCIEKHGYEEGLKIWQDRQNRWRKNFNNSMELLNKKIHDSSSIEFFIKKYGDNYIDRYLDINKKLININIIKDLVFSEKSDNTLINYFIIKNIPYNLKLIKSIASNKLIQHVFNKTYEELVLLFKKSYKINKKQKFGSQIIIDGYSFKSLGEYNLYLFFKENKIEFIYEKIYTNSIKGKKRLKSDFYLPKFNLYIEYCGMFNVKKIQKHKKIIDDYHERVEYKKSFCYQNDLKCLFSSDVESVKKIVLNIIN